LARHDSPDRQEQRNEGNNIDEAIPRWNGDGIQTDQ
jgi:hypothetical protein